MFRSVSKWRHRGEVCRLRLHLVLSFSLFSVMFPCCIWRWLYLQRLACIMNFWISVSFFVLCRSVCWSDIVGEGIMFSSRPTAAFVRSDRSLKYHDMSWTAWAVSMKLAENIHQTPTDDPVRFWRSRSQQNVDVATASTSSLRRRSPFSSFMFCVYAKLSNYVHWSEWCT